MYPYSSFLPTHKAILIHLDLGEGEPVFQEGASGRAAGGANVPGRPPAFIENDRADFRQGVPPPVYLLCGKTDRSGNSSRGIVAGGPHVHEERSGVSGQQLAQFPGVNQRRLFLGGIGFTARRASGLDAPKGPPGAAPCQPATPARSRSQQTRRSLPGAALA